MQEYFKIGELSRLYGIGVDSLRYYEKIGLLQPERSESGYRHYSIREIWKLNLIRDLRALGFSMEQIRQCLQEHTLDGTLDLLEQEKTAIEARIRYLQGLRENVDQRLSSIRAARQREPGSFCLKTFGDRRCYRISQGYSEEHEMDVLIRRLINMDREHLYLVGSNQIGTVISGREARESGRILYESVFVVDPQGEQRIPRGTYLSVCYRGDYSQSSQWVQASIRYAKDHGLKLSGDFLEILWVDIHTSSDVQEHITELQIRAEGSGGDQDPAVDLEPQDPENAAVQPLLGDLP